MNTLQPAPTATQPPRSLGLGLLAGEILVLTWIVAFFGADTPARTNTGWGMVIWLVLLGVAAPVVLGIGALVFHLAKTKKVFWVALTIMAGLTLALGVLSFLGV